MKIVVVNYDELNQLKSCDEIIADICLFYADASESANEELGSVLRGRLDELTASKEAEVSIVDKLTDQINNAIAKAVDNVKELQNEIAQQAEENFDNAIAKVNDQIIGRVNNQKKLTESLLLETQQWNTYSLELTVILSD